MFTGLVVVRRHTEEPRQLMPRAARADAVRREAVIVRRLAMKMEKYMVPILWRDWTEIAE